MACDLRFEGGLHAQGYRSIAGIDEAGRGPLAGPVMAAAVILPTGFRHEILDDSKKLSAKLREALYDELTADVAVSWACGVASVEEIDQINILRASHLAMERAVAALPRPPDFVLIDGLPVREFPVLQKAIVEGDGKSLSIAAASVIAKVERDRYMIRMAETYPHYGFANNKGYGTPEHLRGLRRHGPCPLHRRTFGPVAQTSFDFGDL